MNRLQLGIGQRITLLWAVLFIAGLFSYAVLASATIRREQRETLDADLAAAATSAVIVIRNNPSVVPTIQPNSDVPGLGVLAFKDERLVTKGGAPLPEPLISAAAALDPVGTTTLNISGFRAHGLFVPSPRINHLVVAAPLYSIEEEGERVRNGFVVAGIPIVFFVVLAGYVLARRSLRPIDRITAVAADISRSRTLSTRLGLTSNDELGRLARTFDEMLGQLEKTFERERGFIGDVSHELRNSIGAIIAEGDLSLSRPREREEYRVSLVAMLERARRVGGTIDDLLLLARADAGTLAAEQHSELNEIVTAATSEVQRRRSASIELQLSHETISVVGSVQLLLRVYDNIIDNARKAAKRLVRVHVEVIDTAGVVIVEDDGAGIPPEDREEIFRRFYRHSENYAGVGLGLSIANAIVTSYGGSISVGVSTLGGARFTVSLPLST